MANDTVKIIGGTLDGSRLENAASEATLKLLLDAMKKMQSGNTPEGRKAKKALQDHTTAVEDDTDATEDLSEAKRTLAKDIKWLTGSGFRLLGDALKSTTGLVLDLGSDIARFGVKMLDSQMDVTDFSEAIADSRLNVLGIGSAFDMVIKLLNANYTTFQNLSTSGILLNGTIAELRLEAASQGLELNQLSNILSQNSERFAMLGTATDGARMALRLGARAYDQNANALRAWGVSFEEQAEMFNTYLALNALSLRRRTMSEDQLVDSSLTYVTNLRQLSNLTGKSVKELEQEMAKQNLSASFESFVSTLSAEEQERVRMMVAEYGATYGEAGQELAMASAMGIPPITEAATSMAAVMPQLNDEIANQIALTKSFNGSTEDFMKVVRERNNELANSMQGWIDENSTLARVLMLTGSPLGAAFDDLIRGLNIYAGDIEELNKKRDLEADPTANMIASLNEAFQSLRESAVKLVTNFFNNESVKKSLNDFASWVKTFDYTKFNPFDEEGRKNIAASFNTLMSNMGDIFKSFWEGPNASALRDSISSMFKLIVEEIILAIDSILPTFGAGQRIREERAIATTTPEDIQQIIAAGNNIDSLSESQLVYKEMLDEAVDLQRELNSISQDEIQSNPELASHAAELQRQLDEYMKKLPENSGVYVKSLVDEYRDQMQLSEDAWGKSNRDRAAEQAAFIEQQLKSMGYDTRGRVIAEKETGLSRRNDYETPVPEVKIDPSAETQRRIGTLRATGRMAEPKDIVAKLHAGERVLNPQETQEYNSKASNQSEIIKKLDQLNSTMTMVASLMQQELAIQTRTMRGISGLGTDLNKGLPG